MNPPDLTTLPRALETAAAPLSRRSENQALLALTLGAFAMSLHNQVMGPLLPYVEPGLRDGSDGLLIGSASLAGAVGGLLLGPLVDRKGRRPPMLFGMLLFALGCAGYLLATSRGLVLGTRAVSGFAVGLVYTAASAALADLIPYERRGAAMGVFTAGTYLAAPIGFPLAQQLAGSVGWRVAFGAQALLGILVWLGFWRLLPAGVGRGEHPPAPWRVLQQPMVVPAITTVLLYVGAVTASIQFLATWLDDSGLLPRSEQTLVWVVLGLAMAAGSLLLSGVSDRVGKRTFVLLTTAGVALGFLLLSYVASLTGLWAVGLPLAVVAAARTGPMQALMSELVPGELRGTLMGVRAAAVNLGIGVCAVGAGRFYEAGGRGNGGYELVLMGTAGAIVAAYFLVRLFVREPGR